MGVFFHQLFQSESWKLYRNLGVFSFTFAAKDNAFAVLGLPDALSRTKGVDPSGLLHRELRPVELLAARGKELGDVLDGVVSRPGVAAAAWRARALPVTLVHRALVFVLVVVMPLGVVGIAIG